MVFNILTMCVRYEFNHENSEKHVSSILLLTIVKKKRSNYTFTRYFNTQKSVKYRNRNIYGTDFNYTLFIDLI